MATVIACVLGTMIAGAALKTPCASGDWADGRQYTFLCYSDIVPLLYTEQLGDGRMPFLEECAPVVGQNCDEYPVLTMYFMRIAAWISGPDTSDFYNVNMALLTLCAIAIAVCLYVMAGSRALYFALAPTLLVYGTMNWDLLAVAFATGAMLLFMRKRDTASGLMLGLGAAAKLFPALLALPLIAQRIKQRLPDRAISVGWATAGAWLVVNLGFLMASPGGWFHFFAFNAERNSDYDSLWYIGCRWSTEVGDCLRVGNINLFSAALFLVTLVAVWWMKTRRYPDFPRWTLGFPLLVLFLITNKVYSPQYGLWLLPWFAMALPGIRRFIAFEITDMAVFATRFWWFGKLGGGWGVPQLWFEIMVVARLVVLMWCLVAWVREAHRPMLIELAGSDDTHCAAAEPLPA